MPQMIFVNLPVTDLQRSRRFYQALGYTINENFSDEGGACVVASETIFFMILTQEKFQGFLSGPIGDPAKNTSVLMALSQDNRAAVDEFAARALANGGSEPKKASDLGFMYSRMICDPDGNTFEPFWMDPETAGG